MNIRLLCVGKIKESFFRDALAEYGKRLGRFVKWEVVELPDEKIPDRPSEKECLRVKETEGEKILAKIGAGDYLIAMCIEGKAKSSEELADLLSTCATSGKSTVTFLIGGSLGLSDAVKRRADLRLSVSPMTFPHQLFRVMLAEQIYRAFKIIHNESYHK